MNYFAHSSLYRFSEMRADLTYMDQLWQQEGARVLVVSDQRNLLVQTADLVEAAMLPVASARRLEQLARARVYLGSKNDVPYFALGFEGVQEQLESLLEESYLFAELRSVALTLPHEQSSMLAYARAMVHWNIQHLHCPACGSPTLSSEAGHKRECSNGGCGRAHFPRTDTAVIVLISEGDACLLGRQELWPAGQYATIAGFLEPGETLEQAVAREAMEETGVRLQNICYHSSQPWPFPGTIMVGFSAVAISRELHVNYEELEDARWFTRNEIVKGLQEGKLVMPPPYSISFQLIRDWFNGEERPWLEDYL